MWEKIKAFFSNKITKIVSWIILGIATVALLIGGVTQADVSDGLKLLMYIVDAVAVFSTFITERSGKKKK